jgi:hypothetical protein
VDPSSFEKWVADFGRDRDPEREIGTYEGMADAYRTYCSRHALTPGARQDVFRVVLLRSSAPEDQVFRTLRLTTLTTADAREILAGYRAAPEPIEISGEPAGN